MQYGRNGPKAIETKWHGCRFRSKLEAQWAIVFEVMGLEWEYEPMGFRLGNGLWYMPDFVIAGLVGVGDGWCFVEVKGNMTELDRSKVDEFSRYYPIYVVGEVPYQDPFGTQHRKFAKDTAFHSLSRLFVERSKGVVESGAIGVGHDGMPEIVPEWEWAGDERATRLAFLAACYARFDHGEMPEQQKEFSEAQACIQWLREASKKKGNERKSKMPRLSEAWNSIQESTGTFSDIEPGGYTLVITKVEPVERQQYARFYWDVAEGEHKGAYAQSQWPPSDIVSWKDSVLGILKHKMHVLADSNPSFQPTVAFDNDDWQAFVGKKFGAVVRKRLYTAGPNSKNPGADREAVEIAAWLTPEQVANHDYSDSLLRPRDQREQHPITAGPSVTPVPQTFQPAPQDVYSEDVPF